MILPKDIKSKRHKIRDSKICSLYVRDNMTLEQIGLKVGLTPTRCYQIVNENASLIKTNRDAEKLTRIAALKRMQLKYPDTLGKKSTIDILEQLRKEIEGDKPLIDQSTHTHITGIILDNGKSDEANNIPNRIPEKISI